MTVLLAGQPGRVDVAGFAGTYQIEVARCLARITPQLTQPASVLLDALAGNRGERGVIYLLGNGGSSAIARSLALTGEALATETSTNPTTGAEATPGLDGIRWVGAWDQYRLAACAAISGFDGAATDLLTRDRADPRDLVILISGSGNSRNLLAIARHCLSRSIPLLTITGRTGGALGRLDPDGLRVDSTDQQVVEDVAHAAGLALLHRMADRPVPNLASAVSVNIPWLQALTAATSTAAAACGGRIVVLAPGGGGIGLSAEHAAHNLRWDLRHQNTGARLGVIDGTTLCDDTGMANDTGILGLAAARLLDDADPRDVVLLLGDDADHPSLRAAQAAASERKLRSFGCYRTGRASHATWITNLPAEVMPLTVQTIGHLLLRSLRAATLGPASGGDCEDDAWQPVAPQLARPVR